jgi:hypothetical protein
LPTIQEGKFHNSHEYVPYYAYLNASKDILDQLEIMADIIKDIFGEIDFISRALEQVKLSNAIILTTTKEENLPTQVVQLETPSSEKVL